YMPSRRDMKVFFDFPDTDGATYLGGDKFCCFIDDCGQSANWYKSQKQLVLRSHWKHGLAVSAWLAGEEALAKDIMAGDGSELSASEVDEFSRHIINGRVADAKLVLANWLDTGEE
ncbi:MAG: hypothetical protein L0Z50_38545, partial [Verrucomicrobiales bacterium]|nr:hypothetical protein [Verrucomicrobiales bacterium]